ncbi:MAG TPA: hypothetical protein VFS02_03305 [Telluria sp.]|nr:hypothetical protein [Telluria sp.]
MNPFKLAAIAIAAISFAPPLHAETVDPLWAKTLAHADLVKKWAPADKVTVVDSVDDEKQERVKTKSHLKGWEKGKPVYDTVQVEPKVDAGKSAGKGKNEVNDASNMSDDLMRMDAPVRRTDGQRLHGKTWTTFDVAESKGPVDVSLRVWVDPVTGVAHQTVSKIHGTLMFDMLMTTEYAPHPKVGSLPERMNFKIKVLIPFVDAKVDIVSRMDNWIPRP